MRTSRRRRQREKTRDPPRELPTLSEMQRAETRHNEVNIRQHTKNKKLNGATSSAHIETAREAISCRPIAAENSKRIYEARGSWTDMKSTSTPDPLVTTQSGSAECGSSVSKLGFNFIFGRLNIVGKRSLRPHCSRGHRRLFPSDSLSQS